MEAVYLKRQTNMKLIIFLILVSAVLVKADWKEKSRHMQEKSDNAREACAGKLGLTAKEIKAADNAQGPPATRTEKCIMECLLTETGIMENGKFSRTGLNKIAEYLYDEEPQYLALSLTASKTCEKHVANLKLNDSCDEAAETVQCLAKTAKQLNIKIDPDYKDE